MDRTPWLGGCQPRRVGNPASRRLCRHAEARLAGEHFPWALVGQQDTLFRGETLRGLLLTSYGFSVFGVKGGQGAAVAFIISGLLLLLSLVGLYHAYRTPRSTGFAVPDVVTNGAQKVLVEA